MTKLMNQTAILTRLISQIAAIYTATVIFAGTVTAQVGQGSQDFGVRNKDGQRYRVSQPSPGFGRDAERQRLVKESARLEIQRSRLEGRKANLARQSELLEGNQSSLVREKQALDQMKSQLDSLLDQYRRRPTGNAEWLKQKNEDYNCQVEQYNSRVDEVRRQLDTYNHTAISLKSELAQFNAELRRNQSDLASLNQLPTDPAGYRGLFSDESKRKQ